MLEGFQGKGKVDRKQRNKCFSPNNHILFDLSRYWVFNHRKRSTATNLFAILLIVAPGSVAANA